MNETVFDLIEEKDPGGKESYIQLAGRGPQPKDKSFFNDFKDYAKTIVKGSVEGLGRLGRMMGPLPGEGSTEEVLEKQSQSLNELLPTDEGTVQKTIRRGLKEAPSALANPWAKASSIAYPFISGTAGQTAEELGAPESVQAIAEISSYLTPNVTKKLLEKGKFKELIQIGKKMGLSDEALAPLLQSEFKEKWLTKATPRRGSTEKKLLNVKEELGQAYNKLQGSEVAKKIVPMKHVEKSIEKIDKVLFDMPSGVREKIATDLKDLVNHPVTPETLMNFNKDINHALSGNAKQLSLLKEPIKEAIKGASPEMAKEFEVINDLFSKYYKISQRLKPNLMTDLMGAGEALGIFTSLATGQYPLLYSLAGEKMARKISQQLLFNPRFQQIGHKVVDALNQNKAPLAKKLSDLMSHEIKKTSPEIAKKLETLTEEDFENILNQNR